MRRGWGIVAWIAVVLCAGCVGVGEAQERRFSRAVPGGAELGEQSLLQRTVNGRRVVRSGRIADLGSLEVAASPEGGRRAVREIAQEAFREHDDLATRLRGSRGLMGAPSSTDEAYELDDRVVLVRTTRAVISDPTQVASAAPGLVSRRPTARPVPLAQLDPESRAGLAAFRTEALRYPAGHPLRTAAEQGDEALYRAIEAGAGEVEIVDTIVVPRVEPAGRSIGVTRRADGTFELPALRGGAASGSTAREATIAEAPGPGSSRPLAPAVGAGETERSGEHTTRAEMLNGFTRGRTWEWERRWKFPSGHLLVGASAAYGIGLRVPILLETTTTPTLIERWGEHPGPTEEAEVRIRARTLDGDARHYTAAGLASSQVFGGNELVLQLGFGYRVQFRALFKNWIDINEWRDLINESRSFTPPQSGDWESLVELWIPASATRSEVRIPNVIRGSVQAGARLDARGEIELDVVGMLDGNPIMVAQGQQEPTRLRTLRFPTSTAERRVRLQLPPASAPGTRRYGFEIRNVRYNADLSIVPGARVTLESLVPGFRDRSWSTSLWLEAFRLRVGQATFRTHEGTRETHGHQVARSTYALERPRAEVRPPRQVQRAQ